MTVGIEGQFCTSVKKSEKKLKIKIKKLLKVKIEKNLIKSTNLKNK